MNWYGGIVIRDKQQFVDLRVVVDTLKESPNLDEEDSDSVKEVILAAIHHHATVNNDPKLRWVPSRRYRVYFSYITSRGYDPENDRGFSEKNFQKYETQYRKKFK